MTWARPAVAAGTRGLLLRVPTARWFAHAAAIGMSATGGRCAGAGATAVAATADHANDHGEADQDDADPLFQ